MEMSVVAVSYLATSRFLYCVSRSSCLSIVFSPTDAEETSGMALYAIRSLWNTYQLDKSDTSESNTEEEENEDELSERKQLSMNLSQTLRTRQLLINFHGGRPFFSLRAPLDLVSFPTIPRPRWPIECDVISDIIQHIEWEPPEPEPFYQPTGHERTPMPVGEERGKVVYCSDPATKCGYFTCSRAGGNQDPSKSTTPCVNHTDFALEFESRFESGNLHKAVQVGVYDYELTLRTDMYTMKHTQWFYFRVRNMKAGVTYRFTIINLMKSNSLYSHGMRPLLYSERVAKENGVGWQRIGSNIRHYRNCSQSKKNTSDVIFLYSLTWTCQFPYDLDTCYLAHCYPYTYSHLQRYLRRVSSNPAVASYCQVRVLCHSLAGNAVYVVTITSKAVGGQESRNKKAVVVTARVHPGETNGSWVMEGLLDFLLGDSDDAQLLRDNFVFKVVPMLNPDGVVVGNYRCSLAGRDLNRNYKTLLRDSFPCVWHTRNMVERLMVEKDVVLYCDFHGHSRKNNAFMYGCNNRGDASLKLQERVFPLMMSKNASTKFSFKSCKFRVEKSKEGTGRIVMWRLGIRNSYTMEASFGGSTLGNRKGTHFTTQDLKSLGVCLCDTLLDFCDPDPTKVTYCLTELAAMLSKDVRERIGKDLGTDCNICVSDLETSTSGSNSSDSDGLPVHLLNQHQAVHREQTPVKKKKKCLRTRKVRNRQQNDRVRNNTEPEVLQSGIKNIELNQDNTVKDDIQEKPAGRHRRKWQLNGLIGKAGNPPPTANPGEVSQVTLWQGCKPINTEDECLEYLNTSHLHHKTNACPHHNTLPAVALQSGDPAMNTQQRRCSSQLLHLSAINPSPPRLVHFTKQPHSHPRRSVPSHNVYTRPPITEPCRSPPFMYIRMIPPIQPAKRPQTTFTTSKFSRLHSLRDRDALQASELSFASEPSSTLNTDITKKRLQNDNQDSSEVDVSPFRSEPFCEQNQRDCSSDSPPDRNCVSVQASEEDFV